MRWIPAQNNTGMTREGWVSRAAKLQVDKERAAEPEFRSLLERVKLRKEEENVARNLYNKSHCCAIKASISARVMGRSLLSIWLPVLVMRTLSSMRALISQ